MVRVTESLIENCRGGWDVCLSHLPSAIEIFQKYNKNGDRWCVVPCTESTG